MSNLISNAASGGTEPKSDGENTGRSDPRRDRRREKRLEKIPTANECLAALKHLAGLVAMGLVKPAQSNAIRANYVEILRHHQKIEGRDDPSGISDDGMLEIMRKDPKMLAILEPFLTEDQIDMVMNNATDGVNGKA